MGDRLDFIGVVIFQHAEHIIERIIKPGITLGDYNAGGLSRPDRPQQRFVNFSGPLR
jgi:hypothetical protein